MIYLNHAGTSWPKPKSVTDELNKAISLSPLEWNEHFYGWRDTICKHLNVRSERLLLTPSCTSGLALAISDMEWKPGDQVLTSSMEHHALHRPLFKLVESGVDLITVPRGSDGPFDLEILEHHLKEKETRLVAVSAASNVTGEIFPIEEIVKLAHQYDALVLLDAAQSTGWNVVDPIEAGVDLFAFAGHKGPRATWGIGGVYFAPHVCMNSLPASCEPELTIENDRPCTRIPGFCDAGSVDLLAMSTLASGLDWLAQHPDCFQMANRLGPAISKRTARESGCAIAGTRRKSTTYGSDSARRECHRDRQPIAGSGNHNECGHPMCAVGTPIHWDRS